MISIQNMILLRVRKLEADKNLLIFMYSIHIQFLFRHMCIYSFIISLEIMSHFLVNKIWYDPVSTMS